MPESVLVIGELNVDIVLSGLAASPRFGGEILAEGLQMVLGSASAIFASGIRRLGHPVEFVSKVGDDDFGRFCRNELEREDISTRFVTLSRRPTGATVVLSTKEDRALVTHLGSIADLQYSDLPAGLFSQYGHLHLTSYFLQSGLRADFARIAREARAAGLSVSFDPNSDPTNMWAPAIWTVIEAATVLFLNEAEAMGLSGSSNVEDAIPCLAPRVKCLVVKLGARGSIAVRGKEQVRVEGYPIQVADTTGAGDSFASGFVHAMLSGYMLEDCLKIANAIGALSAMQVGGTSGQPNQATLHDFLERNGADISSGR